MSSPSLKKVEFLHNKSSGNLSNGSNNGSIFNNNNNNSPYSFLLLDNSWGTIQRSGTWTDEELKVVGSLNNDLNKSSNITEMIFRYLHSSNHFFFHFHFILEKIIIIIFFRNEESVVYGYSCGGTKIFYQQSGCASAGLPTPADLMGVVNLKAKRQLERDRDVIIL